MFSSRRAVLAAGVTGLASFATRTRAKTPATTMDQGVADLAKRSQQANAALMRGDVEAYRKLIVLSDDFTLMSPFGGTPSRGSYTDELWQKIGRFFRNGSLRQEVVQTYASADMVVLALIEHGRGEIGGLPAQDWRLRVTLVYRREGADWLLAHRHADPIANGITLQQSAALARGEPAS